MFSKFILGLLVSASAMASVTGARSTFETKMSQNQKYRKLVIELTNAGLYYSAIPWMKEYLVDTSSKLDSELEKAFEKLLTHTGVKQFEILPIKYLLTSKSNSISYVIAKKYYKEKNYSQALSYITKINPNHPIYPFATHLTANLHAAMGDEKKAISSFKDCERSSESRIAGQTGIRKQQLMLNKDYCVLGIARSQFAGRNYSNAELTYLDISKSSPVWPEILFEEAWTSYYLGNYNRTLGKLVTYKAPVFNNYFNPEIEVLDALAYLKLCLYDDAKKISDNFWKNNLNQTLDLRDFLNSKGKNVKYYYRLMMDFTQTKKANSILLSQLLSSIQVDGAYLEIKNSLNEAIDEFNQLNKMSNSSFKKALISNIKEVIEAQKNILGSYIRVSLVSKYAQLYRTFEGMSYIKLEVLQRLKEKLYSFNDEKNIKRGDEKYLQRNQKQYFWDFNGEFWADELGDYVFALKSECN